MSNYVDKLKHILRNGYKFIIDNWFKFTVIILLLVIVIKINDCYKGLDDIKYSLDDHLGNIENSVDSIDSTTNDIYYK